MAKNLEDLKKSIDENTKATDAAVAAFNAASGDFTNQVTAIDANTAKLAALVGGNVPGSPLSASPASLSLNASAPNATVALTEANGAANVFTAVSSNTGIATVSPASGPGPFTVEIAAAGVTGSADVSFTDAQGNVAKVPVTVS